jgi:hypothetical protein
VRRRSGHAVRERDRRRRQFLHEEMMTAPEAMCRDPGRFFADFGNVRSSVVYNSKTVTFEPMQTRVFGPALHVMGITTGTLDVPMWKSQYKDEIRKRFYRFFVVYHGYSFTSRFN